MLVGDKKWQKYLLLQLLCKLVSKSDRKINYGNKQLLYELVTKSDTKIHLYEIFANS